VIFRRRSVGVVAALAASCLFVGACGGSGDSSGGASAGAGAGGGAYPPIPPGPIKLGLSVPLSGGSAAAGLLSKKYFQESALPLFNAMHPHGIDGHPVELDIRNDAGDTTTAVNVANQMVDNHVAAVVNISYNLAAQPLQLAVFSKAKIPVIASVSLSSFDDVDKYPYLFSLAASNTQQGAGSAEWFTRHPEIKSLGILGDGTLSSEDLVSSLKAGLKAKAPGVSIAKTVKIQPGAVNVSTPVAELKGANVDAVLVALSYGHGPVWQAINAAKWSPTIITSALAWYDGFDAIGPLGEKGVGMSSYCIPADPTKLPQPVLDAMDKYTSVPGLTNYLLAAATDTLALEVFAAAVEKVHTLDPGAIKKALESSSSQTYLDFFRLQYTPNSHFGIAGENGPRMCSLSQLGNGKYRIPIAK